MKQDEQEANDLKRIAPNLAALPKDNPFRVPDGYFEKLEGHVMQEIQEDSPVSETKGPPAGFAVPTGYFEELPVILNERISEKKSAPILRRLPRPAFALAMAAAFLAMLLITRPALWFGNEPLPVTGTLTVDELGSSTYLAELDEHHLIEALDEEDSLDPSEWTTDSEVENYLIDNHIDLNQLTSD